MDSDSEAREILIKAIDDDKYKLKELTIVQLANKASNAIYWRDERIKELERNLKDYADRSDAVELRDKWPPCACSYDGPEDVCSSHSPKVAEAESKISRLERVVEAAKKDLKKIDTITNPEIVGKFKRHRRLIIINEIVKEALQALEDEDVRQ